MNTRKLGMRANANVSMYGINWWNFTDQGFQVSRGKPLPNIPQHTRRRIGMLVVETDGGGGALHCPNYNKLHVMTMMVEMIIIIIVTTT